MVGVFCWVVGFNYLRMLGGVWLGVFCGGVGCALVLWVCLNLDLRLILVLFEAGLICRVVLGFGWWICG